MLPSCLPVPVHLGGGLAVFLCCHGVEHCVRFTPFLDLLVPAQAAQVPAVLLLGMLWLMCVQGLPCMLLWLVVTSRLSLSSFSTGVAEQHAASAAIHRVPETCNVGHALGGCAHVCPGLLYLYIQQVALQWRALQKFDEVNACLHAHVLLTAFCLLCVVV
ncbi:hypothetical protein COO60DRAFT_110343 [Scenedesmus sp. NREL 46B-D3]|nr:hypothetical protein COO60DRAFT_110343 [Scenedesmus sp. NREL 46B-D3]